MILSFSRLLGIRLLGGANLHINSNFRMQMPSQRQTERLFLKTYSPQWTAARQQQQQQQSQPQSQNHQSLSWPSQEKGRLGSHLLTMPHRHGLRHLAELSCDSVQGPHLADCRVTP